MRQSDLDITKTQDWSFDYVRSDGASLLERLKTFEKGLSDQEALTRLAFFGFNEPAKKKKRTILVQILSKIFNPLVIVLLIIAGFSEFFGERMSAILVASMASASVLLSFIQEFRAGREAEKLSEMVRSTTGVYRNGKRKEVKIREVVPGDIIDLSAGDIVPADVRILSCKDLFVNQSSLTGESFPIEKFPSVPANQGGGVLPSTIAFMGSSVVSGSALAVAVKTGTMTQFGEISSRLSRRRTETSFDRGINKFTWLMIRLMVVMAAVIFVINYTVKGGFLDALLFSLAVAVGLAPEMLPMLIAINLSKGAIAMAKKQAIVKQLNSIQNFGAMDVLCTDKTGTLTKDKIVLEMHCDVVRRGDADVLRTAYINSFYQTGLKNILDKAILKHEKLLVKSYKKVDEIPFDFSLRIMSVVVEMEGRHRLIAKGAPEEIFKRCTKYELDGETLDMEELIVTDLKEEYDKLSADGFRVLAIAYKDSPTQKEAYSKEDENNLVLKGYLAFLDPPKASAKRAIEVLHKRGIEFKVLTGDNELVTKKVCIAVNLGVKGLITGDQLDRMTDAEAGKCVETTNVFARLSPLQKERIIRLLRENGHVVGYLGDGINDAPALKASDVGISVNNAVDIAKESADIILLKKSLMVLEDGVVEGRKTFGNIIKYIRMGASSNFGNMFSMTGASLFLPFLPMLPMQILLNNFLYDISQVGIPTDHIDREYLLKPKRWDVGAIKRFMFVFGPISSVFDFLTFFILLKVFSAKPDLFHTGWFLESLLTQTLVIYVIRTGKIPFVQSRPSRFMVLTSVSIVLVGLSLPFTSAAEFLGFVKPPVPYFAVLAILLALYLSTVQMAKVWFTKKFGYG